MENFPEGKFLTTVKIGPKGQIVIPKEVRDYRLATVFLYGNVVECC